MSWNKNCAPVHHLVKIYFKSINEEYLNSVVCCKVFNILLLEEVVAFTKFPSYKYTITNSIYPHDIAKHGFGKTRAVALYYMYLY